MFYISLHNAYGNWYLCVCVWCDVGIKIYFPPEIQLMKHYLLRRPPFPYWNAMTVLSYINQSNFSLSSSLMFQLYYFKNDYILF